MNIFHSDDDSTNDVTEVTDEMVEELLSGENIGVPEDDSKEIINTPESEEGGWYDMKALVDYDETATDEDVKMMTENTGEDRLSDSDIPDNPMTPTEKAENRWETDGGKLS